MPEDVAEQEKATPPDKDISENEKVVSKHRLIDRDFIKTNRKRLVLGKKCVSTLVNGQSGMSLSGGVAFSCSATSSGMSDEISAKV
jgi:hypothetical protein